MPTIRPNQHFRVIGKIELPEVTKKSICIRCRYKYESSLGNCPECARASFQHYG